MKARSGNVWSVGRFRLSFDPDGKLAALDLSGGLQVLHRRNFTWALGDGRTYRVDGWDECFPTIEPWRGSPVMGELIGLAPVVQKGDGWVRQVWENDRYRATREFRPDPAGRLELVFGVENRQAVPMEFLWASHALFTTTSLRRVQLSDGRCLDSFGMDGTSGKSFVRAGEPVIFEWAAGSICLQTDQPWWGLWFNRGGWPADRPNQFVCIGMEATQTAGEVPGGFTVAAGGRFSGHVWLEAG